MERDPKALLWDALAAARLLGLFAAKADVERFDRDDMLCSAAERQLDPVTSCDQRSLGTGLKESLIYPGQARWRAGLAQRTIEA